MKNFSLAFFAFLLFSLSAFSQNNEKDISFDLTRPRGLTTVGGSLTIDDNQPIILCTSKNSAEQSLFQSARSSQTVFVDISNLTGNSCVTLVVTTTAGIQKNTIPTNSSTGILRFDKVKSVIVLLENYTNVPGNNNFEAKGKASIWF